MSLPVDYPYEASDEASESELLDKSLSMWRGWGPLENEATFDPIPLDLHTAASIGQYDGVNAFILSGNADLDRPNKGHWTALMYASYIGHDNIVNLLLDAGVNVDVKSDKGSTALMLASSCGNESVAYFLIQQGSDIECRDNKGWNTLFYATFAGHQKMVQFLLESGANINSREPLHKITPLMMAAAEGHEIIVNAFLEYDGIDVGAKSKYGETARSLALLNGQMKIVSLIDNRCMSPALLRSEAGLGAGVDLSSSDESYHRPNRPHGRASRSKVKGPSLRDGPETIAKLLNEKKVHKPAAGPATLSGPIVPGEYVSYQGAGERLTEGPGLRVRDVTSPIGSVDHDVDSYTSKSDSSWQDKPDQDNADGNAFCISGALTIISSGGSSCNSSSGGLKGILSRENSLSSNDETREVKFSPDIERVESPVHIPPGLHPAQTGRGNTASPTAAALKYGNDSRTPHRHTNTAENSAENDSRNAVSAQVASGFIGYHPSVAPLTSMENTDNIGPAAGLDVPVQTSYPFQDLRSLLQSLNLQKYYLKFDEQDVDLRVFLTLTDADLKEVGIKLMGPRRKMTNAIARWHSQARPLSGNLEQVYADRMETAMQEMAIQLSESHLKKEQLEQKVLQERELRSVVEGCLMEDRKMYQQLHSLVSDTRQMCHNMRKIYDTVRSCQAELISRIEQGSGPASPVNTTTSEFGLENLARNLNSQLRLDDMLASKNNNPPMRTSLSQQDSASVMREQLSLASGSSSPHDDEGGGDGSLRQLSMQDLKGMLSHYAHQLGRSVAMATNNMDQLIDGQNPGFSPSNSGNLSLP